MSEDKKTIKIKKVDMETEKKILIGLITNKRFCLNVYPILNTEFLSASYSKRIADWSVDYFKRYNEPIGEHIQDVFNREETNLPEEESSLIKELLLHISMMFDEEDNSFNANYWTDKTLNYLKKKGLEKTIEGVNNNLSLNRIEEAERSLFSYNKTSMETSRIKSMENIDEVAESVFDKESVELATYPGDIGKIMGPLRRRGVHAIFSTGKGGKTFFLVELVLLAARKGHKVLISSHEMSTQEVWQRIVMQLTQRPYDPAKSIGKYGVFDCVSNRVSKCRLPQRINHQKYLTGRKGEEEINPNYLPCDVCRGKSDWYVPTFFLKEQEKPHLTKDYTKKRLEKFLKWEGGKNIRIVSFPQFTANFKDIEQAFTYLRDVENFDVSMIADDYINAHKLNNKDRRLALIEEWHEAKRMADENDICIVSPLHSNRDGMRSDSLDASHISECQDIYNTITSMVAMDTTPELDAYNVVRMRKLADRFGGYNKQEFCYITQCLDHGMFCKDSWLSEFNDKSSAFDKDKKKK